MVERIHISKEILQDLYINKNKSMKEISEELGCCESTIWKNIKKYNFPRKRFGPYDKYNYLDKKILYEEYLINNKSIEEVAEIFKTNTWIIRSRLKKFNLLIRDYNYKGENNPNWGNFKPLYPLKNTLKILDKYKQWRKRIFERDKFICQECFKSGGVLEAHHIKSFKEIFNEFLLYYSQFSPIEDKEVLVRLSTTYEPFWNINNGITLCKSCHKLTNNYKHKNCRRRNW